MRMKTFQADNMQEALLQIKEELGPDAVIVKSVKRTRRVLGRARDYVEVTAALEESLYAKPAGDIEKETPQASRSQGVYNRSAKRDEDGEASTPLSAAVRNLLRSSPSEPQASPSSKTRETAGPFLGQLDEIKGLVETPTRELKGLKEQLQKLVNRVSNLSEGAERLSLEMRGVYHQLKDADLTDALSLELCQKLEQVLPPPERDNEEKVKRILQKVISNRLKCEGPLRYRAGRPAIVMLVGPTGVGKTTTIAKLASVSKFQEGKRVGILSADCFRMGAREQMHIFGEAAGVPVKDIFSPVDIDRSLDELADRDLILVDTAGRSHTHREMWEELGELIPKIAPDEIHLVLSASTRARELGHVFELYRKFGASRVILTKLDECLSLGSIYNLACQKRLKFSYLCDGQQIPDNIRPAAADWLAQHIVGSAYSELHAVSLE